MLPLKCTVCNSKKSQFIKEQEASGMLSQLGIRTPLSKIILLAYICFKCIKINFRYIYKNELDKVCFQHEMACRYFKDLPRRTTSDKVLHDNAF